MEPISKALDSLSDSFIASISSTSLSRSLTLSSDFRPPSLLVSEYYTFLFGFFFYFEADGFDIGYYASAPNEEGDDSNDSLLYGIKSLR
jgi:hypothetical protein